jgi:CSLREA domain-containing protein
MRILLIILLVIATSSAQAAIFLVTKTADTADGICDADCSIREAIIAANSNAGLDDVVLPASIYVLTLEDPTDSDGSASASGDLDVTDDLSLVGSGADVTIIDGNGTSRVIDIWSSSVAVSHVTIRNGIAIIGGGIYNSGILTLEHTIIQGNLATGRFAGGGIFGGPLTVSNSLIEGNTASHVNGLGGGIMGCEVALIDSTVRDNTSWKGAGLGPFCNDRGTTIENSTISGNIGRNAIYNGVGNDTNVARLFITNTIVADNSVINCAPFVGSVPSSGHNLDDDGSCNFTQSGDLSNVPDAGLGPLADNGGPTQTHDLLPSSPAIDAIPLVDCIEPFDQRGVERPQGSACDIGAVEYVPEPTAIALQIAALICTGLVALGRRGVLPPPLTASPPVCRGASVGWSASDEFPAGGNK